MKISDLFTIESGISGANLKIYPEQTENTVAFIRPAKTQQRTLSGWINRNDVLSTHIYPSGTLFVSTNGEGSHTYSYVSRFEFVPNSDVSILIPKKSISINEKIFYASCITLNRPKFSYGRKPKGQRLANIEIPDACPSWVNSGNLDVSFETPNTISNNQRNNKSSLHIVESNICTIDDIFEVVYGTNLELVRLEKDPLGINYVSRTSKNNGVIARIKCH